MELNRQTIDEYIDSRIHTDRMYRKVSDNEPEPPWVYIPSSTQLRRIAEILDKSIKGSSNAAYKTLFFTYRGYRFFTERGN